MALKPLPPRDNSAKERERYRIDMQVARDNPLAYNRVNSPETLARKLKQETDSRIILGKRD